MTPYYQVHTLSNGLRIIHLPTESTVAYCGYAVNVGTRDEDSEEFGIAHFVEHLLFKGTRKRNSWHILNRMEVVGGELNAYTSKEETFVHATFLESHIERAIDLLSDLVFHSKFPEAEIEKEVEVILDEINSYKDNPSELIYDEFENLLFARHSLGHNILGEADHLKNFTQKHGLAFTAKHYTPDNMIFFSMGSTKFEKIIRLLDKHAGQVQSKSESKKRVPPIAITGETRIEEHDTHQSHVIIGARGYSLHHPDRLALYLLNNILGGPGMNSRLNLALRERNGYVYSVESNLTSYSDTGVLAIYFGSDPRNRRKCIKLVEKEINLLKSKQLTERQLIASKKQLIGQIGVSVENRESLALAMGKSFLHFNRFESIEDVSRRIDQLSAKQLMDVANDVFAESQMFQLIYE